MAKVLITGITGQVGSYLAEYLLEKDYEVDGLDRRKSVSNYDNIEHIQDKINLIEADLTDVFGIQKIVKDGQYNAIYNLAAQSHVGTSFKQPQTTLDINAGGVLNLLESIKTHSMHTKFYQASTSELFGSSAPPQSETTEFHPRSPYGVSKLAAHWYVKNYHEAYDLKASCGIMFNTESKRRGKNFVTRKITEWVKEYKAYCALEDNGRSVDYGDPTLHMPTLSTLTLGNLDAKRDWSHCKDSVDAIYRVCNQDQFNTNFDGVYKPYAFGSGKAMTVRDFVLAALVEAFPESPRNRWKFSGDGLNEHAVDTQKNERLIVVVSKDFYRPAEVDFLQCDPSLIKHELGWKPRYNLNQLVKDMIEN